MFTIPRIVSVLIFGTLLFTEVPPAVDSSSSTAYAHFEETDRIRDTREVLTVSIEPGERLQDLVYLLTAEGLITEDTLLSELARQVVDLPIVLPNSDGIRLYEGLLVPGTYRYSQHDLPRVHPETPSTVAARNAQVLLCPLIRAAHARLDSLEPGYLDKYNQIVLARIVEKETVYSGEYGEVAAVFYRRLQSGIPFGSCPSVEYVLGYHRPFLTSDDVSIASPYNLYRYSGLTPTPICFFSDSALRTVVNPRET